MMVDSTTCDFQFYFLRELWLKKKKESGVLRLQSIITVYHNNHYYCYCYCNNNNNYNNNYYYYIMWTLYMFQN